MLPNSSEKVENVVEDKFKKVELIDIKTTAERCEISVQAVYKKLQKGEEIFTRNLVIKGGKKFLKADVVEEYLNSLNSLNQDFETIYETEEVLEPETETKSTGLELVENLVESLQMQLNAKDEQIRSLNQQLSQINQALINQQQLTSQAQQLQAKQQLLLPENSQKDKDKINELEKQIDALKEELRIEKLPFWQRKKANKK